MGEMSKNQGADRNQNPCSHDSRGGVLRPRTKNGKPRAEGAARFLKGPYERETFWLRKPEGSHRERNRGSAGEEGPHSSGKKDET